MPKGAKPRVSIGLPVYNGEAFIKDTIASILAQTFEDFEIIVVDNGSTDTTAESIQSFPDKRIRYFHHPERCGIAQLRNFGVKKAKGKSKFNADDSDEDSSSDSDSSDGKSRRKKKKAKSKKKSKIRSNDYDSDTDDDDTSSSSDSDDSSAGKTKKKKGKNKNNSNTILPIDVSITAIGLEIIESTELAG